MLISAVSKIFDKKIGRGANTCHFAPSPASTPLLISDQQLQVVTMVVIAVSVKITTNI